MANQIDHSHYTVAIIGGAAAGAEVAQRLAENGLTVVVFEKNPRPFGKIEDGLPRWHEAQREKEYASITAKLDNERIHFVPNTRIGRDIPFPELASTWGFHAVVLACGAWGDRPLEVEGAKACEGKGLLYQNPLIYWFNHYQEPGYQGSQFCLEDGGYVIGGGLASIDVVKILMLEATSRALAKRGVQRTVIELERMGIPEALEKHGLTWDELGLRKATLVYRRRIEDMPVMNIPSDSDAAKRAKLEQARLRLVNKAAEKFLFQVEPLAQPDALVMENDHLVRLRLRRTHIEGRSVVPTDETFEVPTRLVVSSIGSIPEPIPGIAMKGELFDFIDWELGKLEGYPSVFGAGNVVTGKGNIIASRKHAGQIAEHAVEEFLGLRPRQPIGDDSVPQQIGRAAAEAVDGITQHVREQRPLSDQHYEELLNRVHNRQKAVGYSGDLQAWLAKVSPTQAH